ncbi:hypothetical protein Apa02nite_078290 [Actinoplanes palleronii]|uniref:Uncharacterized protein n=1 Tax=Actinoplanes palleronii TaxID=113570 RepID=A0ABQ4BM32_9ACTN|nr:hypothetical protein Apa02nite_078290 [Actinoplanes palleronii]
MSGQLSGSPGLLTTDWSQTGSELPDDGHPASDSTAAVARPAAIRTRRIALRVGIVTAVYVTATPGHSAPLSGGWCWRLSRERGQP